MASARICRGVWFAVGVDALLAAASTLFGQPLTAPEELGGSGRSVVVRALAADGRSVVVKKYVESDEGVLSFAAESAGLAHTQLGPELLAADPGELMLVMSDLGEHASVADRLLDSDRPLGIAALRDWAVAYATLAASTAARHDEFASLWARYSRGRPMRSDRAAYARGVTAFLRRAEAVGVVVDEVETELQRLNVILDEHCSRFPVFSPGDICPDNNVLTPGGLKMLDFESASYHSLFLDAAYATMPFPTCWCAFRLPEGLPGQIEDWYRAQVLDTYPDLRDDALWHAGVRAAAAIWTIRTTRLLDLAQDDDLPMHPQRLSPSIRQIVRHRWTSLLQTLSDTGELPALARCLESLLALTNEWNVAPLPLYPVFR